MDIKIDQNFACVLNGLLVALGANMAPKASQKPPRGAVHFPPVFGLEGLLGGSWGALGASWGPRADFDRIFIDF